MDNLNKGRNFSSIIRTIYIYLFSAIGLALVIIGLLRGSQYLAKKIFLPKYDLGFEEQRCDYLPAPVVQEKIGQDQNYLKVTENQKKDCKLRLEEQRKAREVTDVASTLSFLVIGSLLFIFHYRLTKGKPTV